MKIQKFIGKAIFSVWLNVFALLIFFAVSQAQSTNQSFPTPVTTNEISGRIAARDIGDARLTSYFYVFNGGQGDVFINVVTKNLNGDVDVFTADNLRPLAKITLYADATESETGRVIYLRQPTKLVLRVEGRTPNDEAATFRIKFAGSFAPAQAVETAELEAPTVKTDNQTDVRVNSVGTIIEIKPKPTPKPKEIVAETKAKRDKETKELTRENKEISEIKAETKETDKQSTVTETESKPALVVTNELPKDETVQAENQSNKEVVEETKKETTESETDKTASEEKPAAKVEPKVSRRPKVVKPVPSAALENIRLVISFKDGTRIERPMSEVLRFGIDRGVLTVILKDGTIGRYSLLDVEKTTIE